MGSSIKINSISIDLAGIPNEVDTGKCEHFSMRGFVAEIRQRDRGKCWPFSADSADLEDHISYRLPSLSVPKSRWWRCTNCVKDISTEGMNGSDCQLHPKSRALREKRFGANVSIIPIKSDWNSPICTNKKERKADNAGKVTDRNENVNRDERCRREDHTATLLKKVRRRSVDATGGSKSRKLANPGNASKKSKEKVNISVEINWKENQEGVNGQFAEALTTFGSSEIAGVVDDMPKAIKNLKGGRVLMELDECGNVSSESATVARNFLDHNPDNVTGLQRRKTRKVRLLRELLSKSSTKSGGNVRNEESPSKKESFRGRKRKSSGDEEWRPPETTASENNYANRKLSTIGKTSENTSQSCESEGNVLSGIGSQPSVEESQSTDGGFDKDPIKGKQKNRRFQVVDEHLPAVSRENSQKSIQENDEGSPKCDPGKSNFPSSVHSSFTGKAFVPCPLHTRRTEKKPSLAKKKCKKTLIDNNQSTMIALGNSLVGRNQTEARKSEVLQISSINAVSQSIQDVSNGKGLEPSLDKILASEGYVRKYISHPDQRPGFSLLSQDIRHRDNHVRPKEAETNHFRDFASPSKSNADGYLRTGVYIDRSCNGNTNRLPFLNEKLSLMPSAEVVDNSLLMQKDISGAYSKGKGVLIQSDPRKEKTPEHIDDIPMEIVELMAKNQYERCLPDKDEVTDKNSKQPSQTTTSTSKSGLLIDLNKTYENGASLEDNTYRQQNPHGQNVRKDDATKGEHFAAEKPHSVDFSPRSQFGHPYVPSGLGMFPLMREKPSGSIQFSSSGSSGQSIHSCQWLRNVPTVASQSPSPSLFSGALCPRNTCQSVQPYREASHPIWPSSMVPQNQMPVSINIPRKFMDQSTKRDILSQGSNNDMNSWNLNFLDNGKQKRGFDSEFSFGCKHGGVGSRSLDPYTNESSIPAMHLLSLMDPRLRSNTPVDLLGNPKLPKRPFLQGHQSKEYLGLQPMESSKTPNSTKQLAFDFYGKRSAGVDFAVQASWNYPEKRVKTKDGISPNQNNRQKSIFTSSCDPGNFQILGASDSMMLPLKFHTTDYAKKNKAKAQSCNASALPMKSNGGTTIMCSMNRNPADFTIPEPGNIYMRRGEDLKFRKRGSYKKKPSLCKHNELKQNKTTVGPAAS
ncbi:PREDICTED: protein EMBRYONIC FLOWER 1-like isoform X2 [Tarenaya hassleriana]|uniref:protein EMBRYONIC FLOWER 1-like isoform X2 n=1 Tax=Tarenaya hassleriana TaxID=28532 RepID=UPI00053C21CF|nr:PREDICTED: protein EMBRYONIC FLOWER 1-like isoform X2 [Tarenaya hassleriana]